MFDRTIFVLHNLVVKSIKIIRAVEETEPINFEPGKRDGEVVYRYDSVSDNGEEFTVLVVDQPEYLLVVHANPLKWSTR